MSEMNRPSDTGAGNVFDAAMDRAAGLRHNRGDAHTIRGVGRAFRQWSEANGVDPLHPIRDDISRFLADSDYANASKVRWALRAVMRAADLATDAHGLGTGNQSHRLVAVEGTAVGCVTDEVLSHAPGRLPMWRSGLNKLLTWASECGIDPLELTAPDLDDYRVWICEVGGDEGELLEIARRFVWTRLRLTMRIAHTKWGPSEIRGGVRSPSTIVAKVGASSRPGASG